MDLAARSVDEGCRLVALKHLAQAEAARARLGADSEALHDFRVALRRLRSISRAYRRWLGRPKRKLQRRLRRLVEATGVGVGLALVAQFAALHGGRAWVEDNPGGGASFRVLFPGATG